MGLFGKSNVASPLGLESSRELEASREPLVLQESQIRELLDSQKKELAKYDTDAYRFVRSSILVPERQRLVELLMGVEEDDASRDARLRIRAQHAQVLHLMDRPEALKIEIRESETALLDVLTKISEVDAKIKSAKAREE